MMVPGSTRFERFLFLRKKIWIYIHIFIYPMRMYISILQMFKELNIPPLWDADPS